MIIKTGQSLEVAEHHNLCSPFVEIDSLGTPEISMSRAADMAEDFVCLFGCM